MRLELPFLFLLAWVLAAECAGQHSPLTSQYLFNGLAINPAYAGSRDVLSATLTHRQQWVGFEGAPVTQTLSVHTPVKRSPVSLGLMIFNDRIGVSNETGILSNYAYRVRMPNKAKLSLGFGAGLSLYRAQWTQVAIADASDASFAGDTRGAVRPNFSTGALYQTKTWYVGASVPFLLAHRYDLVNREFRLASEKLNFQPMLTGGYLFILNDELKLKPTTLLRYRLESGLQGDVNANLIPSRQGVAGRLGANRRQRGGHARGAADAPMARRLRLRHRHLLFASLPPWLSRVAGAVRIRLPHSGARPALLLTIMRLSHAIALLIAAVPPVQAQLIHEVRRIDIRPSGEDYAPCWLDSGFVMSSVRDNAALVVFVDAETGKPLSDLYWVPIQDGKAGTPVLFSQNLTTPVNEGPATFTDQGRTICYTRNQVLPKKLSNMRAANGQLGLFFSHQENGTWLAPSPFAHNEAKSSNLHPEFSADGRTLYFASDRPGGYGGMDLYRSERHSDGWGAPINLGPAINGPSDEVFPRIHADGSLYFASNRAGGLGGLDIYSARHDGEAWAMPVALPSPVNSKANDHGYELMADGYNAIFTSNRDGSDAIFMDKITVEKFRDCAEQKPNNYCYSLRKRPHAATASIPVDHEWDMGDGTRIKGYQAQHCYTKPGRYMVRSLLVDRKTGETFHALSEQPIEVADHEQAWIATQDTIRTGRRFELHAGLSYMPGLKPAEYHWDLGDGARVEGARADETNLLAEANGDVTFSVQLFASKDRIDLDDPRFAQIRKLYRVVERYDPATALYTYSVGEAKSADELYQVYKKVKELQFLDAEVFALRVEKLMDLSQLDLSRIEELNHKKLRTNAIHFAYKSSLLEESSMPVLDQIIGLLRQHPELKLVIEAHTDDIGGHRYNMELSQQRALAVMEHLIENEVLPERLVPIGHGKNQPIASNKTEEGRALNRRVEFRMTIDGAPSGAKEQLTRAMPRRVNPR
ncbi:MAG: PorP/SprF family type IX secretion system membrane protein [Flavobacteriales bacterium]|nr:PorP/SprF family type IX secretion system membrane protein [Flavobacteriales bacterium]